MELYLNEWSAGPLADGGYSVERCNPFRFFDLLKKLKDKGVSKVYFPEEVRQGFLSVCIHSGNQDLRNLALAFKPLLEKCAVCSEYAMTADGNDAFYSMFAGISWKAGLPLVCLCHSEADCEDMVPGTIWQGSEAGGWRVLKTAQTVGNLYDDNLASFASFWEQLAFRECSRKHAEQEPIWNFGEVNRIMKAYGFPLVGLESGELMAQLEKAGTEIAECNGWVYDERVTKNNNSDKVHRVIFKSKHFIRSNNYLSIDFEHPDGRFELHDKKGKHLGERYFRDGKDTGAKISSNHNIEV